MTDKAALTEEEKLKEISDKTRQVQEVSIKATQKKKKLLKRLMGQAAAQKEFIRKAEVCAKEVEKLKLELSEIYFLAGLDWLMKRRATTTGVDLHMLYYNSTAFRDILAEFGRDFDFE